MDRQPISSTARSITPADDRERRIYESFRAELTDGDDLPPSAGSRDAKYYLKLQRDKMSRYGITVREKLESGGVLRNITGSVFESDKYRGHLLFQGYKRKAEYFRENRKVFVQKGKLTLYQMLVDAKGGIDPKETFCCPSCGGINTAEELESGCRFCGARFMMSELYPKIVSFFWLRDYSMNYGEMGKRILKWIVLVTAAMGVLGWAVADKFIEITGGQLERGAVIAAFAVTGAIAAPFLSLIALFGSVLKDAIKAVPILSRTSGDKRRIEEAVRPHDPYFFYGIFESKVISLMKIMLYSKDLSDCAVWCGSQPPEENDVIEAVYRGAIDIEDIREENGNTYVRLTVFTDCIHGGRGRFYRKNEEYRMEIVRSVSALTDQGFTITKAECPSCGASFDASVTKHCPYCGRDFVLKDKDWAVLSFRKA